MSATTAVFAGLFSALNPRYAAGTRAIAGQIEGAAHYASATGYADWADVAGQIERDHAAGALARPLSLIGHSNGVYAILKIAERLAKAGIEVDYLAAIDKTLKRCPPAGANVKLAHDFYAGLSRVAFADDFPGERKFFDLDKIVGDVGHVEAAQIDFTQRTIVDTVTRLAGGTPADPRSAVEPFYIGEGRRLDDGDFAAMSARHEIPEYLLRAVVQVEAAGKGSHSSGALVFRYELHKAYQFSRGAKRGELVAAGLANPSYKAALAWPHANSYPHLERAAAVAGEELACLASSWGLGQIMGFNHRAVGFDTALAMVRRLAASEADQVEAMIAFIGSKGLKDDLLAGRWDAFARGYNGRAYKANRYDEKLADAAAFWKARLGAGIADEPQPAPPDPGLPPSDPPIAIEAGALTLDRLRALDSGDLRAATRTAADLIKLASLVLDEREASPGKATSQGGRFLPPPPKEQTMGTTLNLKSKTFWVGALMAIAGAAVGILPEGNAIADIARSFYPNADAGTLLTGGLAIIFGREAIAKNGLGK